MGFSCSICDGSLEKPSLLNPTAPPTGNLAMASTTHCGHLFHTLCIQQWFETSETCPKCRDGIPGKRVIPIFPDSLDESVGSVGDRSRGEMEMEMATLNSKVQSMEEALVEQTQLYEAECQVTQSLNQALSSERTKSDNLSLESKRFESYKDVFSKNTERIIELEKELEVANQRIVDQRNMRKEIENAFIRGMLRLKEEPLTAGQAVELELANELAQALGDEWVATIRIKVIKHETPK